MTSKERVKNTHTDDRRTHTKMRNKRSRTELFFRSNKQKKREQTKRSQAKKIRKKRWWWWKSYVKNLHWRSMWNIMRRSKKKYQRNWNKIINLVWASPAVLSVMFLYIEFPTPQIIWKDTHFIVSSWEMKEKHIRLYTKFSCVII